MNYLKRVSRIHGEEAVSPVVGVMLMLVVTIIIAAVVSGYAGGLVGGGNNQKTPTLAMDVKIVNTGTAAGSGFFATVLGISDPTPSRNLKITTSWSTTVKNSTVYGSFGSTIVGGATIMYGNKSLWGFGPGVNGNVSISPPYDVNQTFGNYTLVQGTGMIAEPNPAYAGYTGDGSTGAGQSAMRDLMGTTWGELRPGDVVSVRVMYVPTGKMIFQKDVAVTGA